MSDGYREHAPSLVLARHVDKLWVRDGVSTHAQRVLPDGCVDIIVQLGDEPRAEVVGTMTTALLVPPGARRMVAVRMRAGAAASVLGQPVDALTDRRVALDVWWRDAAALYDALAAATDSHAQLAILAARLTRALVDAPPIDREVEHAAMRLAGEAPPTIAALARELGRSRQHLARRFTAAVGVGPKVFARVARLARLVRSLRAAPDWAELAAAHGYADQAHLVHDFGALVGCTPGQYAAGSIPPIRAAAADVVSSARP
ncbi:MAG TPA: helix-turn-helix transcriptional regulator [Nannocystaceae bacterium]|nr:helix-turn-helix transcriptional regulator [Nannocystaceae bacterium]